MSSTRTPDIDPVLAEDAVKALIKYEQKKQSESGKAQLIADLPKFIYVQIQLKKPLAQKVQKPVRVKIPHSLYNPEDEDHSVCLFCRTDDKAQIEAYLEAHPIAGLQKVFSMSDVKKQLKDFKARKALLAQHTHFLCHTAIARQLYNMVGSDFAKRNAFPVQCSWDSPAQLDKVVSRAVSASYLHLAGSNLVLPLGKLSLSVAQNVENIVEGVRFAINEKITNGWSSVAGVHLKTKDSAALPVFTSTEGDAVIAFMQSQGQKDKKQAKTKPAAPAAAVVPAASTEKKQDKQKNKKREREGDEAPAAEAVAQKQAAPQSEAPQKKKKVVKK